MEVYGKSYSLRWILLLVSHFALAAGGSMLIGFMPEAFVSKFYYNTGIEPYSPVIALIALLLGYFVAARALTVRAGTWTWIVGLVWLLIGIEELTHYWAASWSPEKTRWGYAVANLVGPTLK